MSELTIPNRESDAGPDTRRSADANWRKECDEVAFLFRDISDAEPEEGLAMLAKAERSIAEIKAARLAEWEMLP